MRVRDFIVIIFIAGIFMIGFNFLLDTDNLSTIYNTSAQHSNESSYQTLRDSVISSSTDIQNETADLQTQLSKEETIGLGDVGGATLSLLKYVASFKYLNAIKEPIEILATEIGVDPTMMGLIFGILLVIILFAVIGAFLRWRT